MCQRIDPMPYADAESDPAQTLREQAEESIKGQPPPENPAGMTAIEMQRIIHELLVKQIELEAKNEELERQRAELAAAEIRSAHLKESLRIKSLAFDWAIIANSIANTEGIITQVNAAFLRIWGFASEEEVVGHPIPYFIQNPQEAAAIIAALDDTGFWEGSFGGKRKDGSSFIAQGQAATMRNELGQAIGYQSSVLDITKQKQAELALQEWNQTLERRVAERTMELEQSKARFRQLAEIPFEGIAISEGGILIDGNSQLGAMHGCELAEMIGRPLLDFVAPEAHARVTENIRKGDEIIYESVGLRKDGSTFPSEVHGRMGSWQGRTLRLTALRDLTETKRLAAEFLTQKTALEHSMRLALVSEVCAGIVHQISQPLSAMGANLAVIQTRLEAAPETCGETMEILRDIIGSATATREMIHHLRTLLHAEPPNYLPTDIDSLLAETLPLLRQEAEYRGIRFATELGSGLPTVLADAVQLTQVILNLTRNAFDACMACPPDRRVVVLATRAVGGTAVELSVRDTGTGIATEVIDHLFAPFFTTKAGMGIGLRLSRTIIESYGGTIAASNNADGIGATFRLTLPGLPKLGAADVGK